jgi:hypothetical protein
MTTNPLFKHINDKLPELGNVGLEHAGRCESTYRSTAEGWAGLRPTEPSDPPATPKGDGPKRAK